MTYEGHHHDRHTFHPHRPQRHGAAVAAARGTCSNKLTGDATFVEVFAQAPEMLEFVMQQFYAKVFFGGAVEQRYKQLARLKLSLIHGCRTCNKQNIPGALEAGIHAGADRCAHRRQRRAVRPRRTRRHRLCGTDRTAEHGRPNVAGAVSSLRAHFSEAQILELGTAMAVISGMAKLSFVLDLVERESYCPFAAGGGGGRIAARGRPRRRHVTACHAVSGPDLK